MIVRAFDGTRREVIGMITLPLEIGPSKFEVEFQVMNIDPAYTMLLGRPWIHMAQAVPSTLHQRMKYIDRGRLITIKGEEELMVSKPTAIPYIEAAEEALESSFQSLEMDKAKGIHSVACRIMKKNGFQAGKGLGTKLQGIAGPLVIPENLNRQGLGYQATLEEDFNQKAAVKWHHKAKGVEIPHIKTTFPAPTEVIHMPDVMALMEEGSRTQHLVRLSGIPLDNWSSDDIPDVVTLE